MSHSYRRLPIFGNCVANSEKKDKRIANRRYRRITRQLVRMGAYDRLPLAREISNVWDFAKDGKRWFANATREWMRK